MTRRMYSERLAWWHFVTSLVGLNIVFFTMHFLGLQGMPRRYFDYDVEFWSLNWFATVGAFVLGFGQLFFIVNVVKSYFWGAPSARDPWGEPPRAPEEGAARVPAVVADGSSGGSLTSGEEAPRAP